MCSLQLVSLYCFSIWEVAEPFRGAAWMVESESPWSGPLKVMPSHSPTRPLGPVTRWGVSTSHPSCPRPWASWWTEIHNTLNPNKLPSSFKLLCQIFCYNKRNKYNVLAIHWLTCENTRLFIFPRLECYEHQPPTKSLPNCYLTRLCYCLYTQMQTLASIRILSVLITYQEKYTYWEMCERKTMKINTSGPVYRYMKLMLRPLGQRWYSWYTDACIGFKTFWKGFFLSLGSSFTFGSRLSQMEALTISSWTWVLWILMYF